MNMVPDGFLSSHLEPWRQQARAEAHAWFSLVEDLNRSAVNILPKLTPNKGSDRELGAAILFARTVQSFEATIILAERGMLADAGSIARNIVECAIYLGGLARIEDFPKRLAAENNRHFFTMAKALTQLGEEVMPKKDAADLLELLSEVEEQGHARKSINLRELAVEVEFDALYDLVYRKLSGEAAHVSLASVERHVIRSASGQVERMRFGPQREGLESILSAAVSALLGAMEAVLLIFPHQAIREAIDTHNIRHHCLATTA